MEDFARAKAALEKANIPYPYVRITEKGIEDARIALGSPTEPVGEFK